MRAHHLLEALDRNPTPLNLKAAKMVKEAQKFAFNPDEITDDIANGANDFARDLIRNGIFPLPYDVTLFEFGPMRLVEGNAVSGFMWCLVWKHRENDRATKLYMMVFSKIAGAPVMPCPLLAEVDVSKPNEGGWWGHYNIIGIDEPSMDVYNKGKSQARLNLGGFRDSLATQLRRDGLGDCEAHLQSAIDSVINDDSGGECIGALNMTLDIGFGQVLNAIGLMSTRGVSAIEKPAPKFMNLARKKKGKHPLYAFKTLTIDPTLLRIPGAKIAGDRASPRLHLRRGHVRTRKDGHKSMVRPSLVGNKSEGAVMKDYVVDISKGMSTKEQDAPVADSTLLSE